MNLIGVIADLFSWVDVVGDESKWVLADDVDLWAPGTVEALQAAGVLRRGSALTRVSCDECVEPHEEVVLFSSHRPQRPFIPCPSNGRVFLEPGGLLRWSVSARATAACLASALGTGVTPAEIISARCWSLGNCHLPGFKGPAFLLRGAFWPDARDTFAGRLPLTPRPLLFTLSPAVQPEWSSPGCWLCASHVIREGTEGQLEFDLSGLELELDKTAIGPPQYALQRQTKLWTVTFDGRSATLPGRVGFLYLAQLLAHPGRAFAALELSALTAGHGPAPMLSTEDASSLTQSSGFGLDELADAEAVKQYQAAATALDAKKRSAGLSPEEATELASLQRELARTLGLHNKPRRTSGEAEKARTNVWHALQRTYDALEPDLPRLARHLKNSVERGSTFCYQPSDPIVWSVDRA